MDINTVKLIRNSLNNKEVKAEESQAKKTDKRNSNRGCLKLSDYMAF